MKLKIVPYKMESKSARLLAEQLTQRLGYKVWRGSPRVKRINLCWGYHKAVDEFDQERFLNHPDLANVARDKRRTFRHLSNKKVSHVPYTETKEEAAGWLTKGKTVFARTATGQAGSGITVVQPGQELPTAPLYTQYVKKKKEFRVHVFNGKVIQVQEKRKRNGADADVLVRSHRRGWVFCQQNVVEPEGLRELGIAAVAALNLDFGGVDIIWNEHYNKCYVLEVNSAPGLEGSTLEAYTNAIVEYVNGVPAA